jgi:hypothetical protein
MTTKELFIEKQPELAAYLASVARSTQFQLALIVVKAEVLRRSQSREFIDGALFFEETLMTIAIEDDPEADSQPQPGLIDPSFPNSITAKQNQPQES